MLIQRAKNHRKLVPSRCRYCDRQFFYRQPGRPKFFCTDKCKQAEFRYARATPRGFDAKRNEIAPKTLVKPKTSKADFGDRPPPLNVLGSSSHRWSNSTSIDSDTLKVVINTEIGSTTSASILTVAQKQEVARLIESIPDDLAIPAWLRRMP